MIKPTKLKRKTIGALLALGAAGCVLWVAFAPDDDTEDGPECGRTSVELLNSIHIGNAFQPLRNDFDKKRIRYDFLYPGMDPLESEKSGKPFEVVATVKRGGSIIVARKEVIVLKVDAGGQITEKFCKVFFTGP